MITKAFPTCSSLDIICLDYFFFQLTFGRKDVGYGSHWMESIAWALNRHGVRIFLLPLKYDYDETSTYQAYTVGFNVTGICHMHLYFH